MKQITLDGTGFQNFQTGVGRYAFNLIDHIAQCDCPFRFRLLVSHRLAEDHPIYALAARYPHVRIAPIRAPAIGPRRDIRFALPIGKYDLFHALNSNVPLTAHKNIVVTVHDIIYHHYPHFFGRTARLKAIYYRSIMCHGARVAREIIAVSQTTADDFMRHFGHHRRQLPPPQVIYEGVSNPSPVTRHSQYASPSFRYFLYVGEHRPHKNIATLLAAFTYFRAHYCPQEDIRLLLAGARHATYTLPDPLPANVEYVGVVTDDELHHLYAHAIALCFISLYEGFGLPILEAMQRKTPVITSNRTATAEIGSSAALLVDPLNRAHIARAMHTLSSSEDRRAAYIRRGKQRVSQFTWQQMARKTLAVYERLLG